MIELAAAGHSDYEVAMAVGRKPKWVAEILTNPIYIGLLRDGSNSAVGPVVDAANWEVVQARRQARRTRAPGQVRRTSEYALRVRCIGCGEYLFGDTGRYRHPRPVCEEFMAAAPEAVPVRGRHAKTAGHSYPKEWYEGLAEVLLRRAGAASDELVRAVIAARSPDSAAPNEVALARIARDRDEATRRLTETRDVVAWQARRRSWTPKSHLPERWLGTGSPTRKWRPTCATCRPSGATPTREGASRWRVRSGRTSPPWAGRG
jgi:hypothetical protein